MTYREPPGGVPCEAHGLRYDPRTHPGCVLCRRAAGEDVEDAPRSWWSWQRAVGVGVALVVVAGGGLALARPLLWPSADAEAVRAYLEPTRARLLHDARAQEDIALRIRTLSDELATAPWGRVRRGLPEARALHARLLAQRAALARIPAPPSARRHRALVDAMYAAIERSSNAWIASIELADRADRDLTGRRARVRQARNEALTRALERAHRDYVESCERLLVEDARLARRHGWPWTSALDLDCGR